ncbi:elongation of very long chain fatty acids protein AAEL008004-like [Aricia agestis]|uniref:elongation of very long chain fatty acids protein AAEL008004-like n=1 Tax=Aricia agestis TaxID=91739 RepID=UPI001C20B5EF|nr:elongation of very long chain fatty acids protein AAEL008004-like [Aricia agestis]
MAAVLSYIAELYERISQLRDPRMKTLPLVQVSDIIIIITLYLLFVFKWGPRFMRNRRPFQIDNIVMVYNALQVLGCALMVFYASRKWIREYKLFCQPVDRSNTPEAWEAILLNYYYYLLKVADLFDTVFFVFRKKQSHITFLHVYHHAGMIALVGGSVNFAPAGHGGSVGIINSFVHCFMYFYYFLTIYKPEYKENIWWKKYVTQLQIVQFFIFVVHMGSIAVIKDCDYPVFAVFVFLPQNIFMLIMFIDFYIKTYIKNSKGKKNEEMENTESIQEKIGKVEEIVANGKNNVKLRNGHR